MWWASEVPGSLCNNWQTQARAFSELLDKLLALKYPLNLRKRMIWDKTPYKCRLQPIFTIVICLYVSQIFILELFFMLL